VAAAGGFLALLSAEDRADLDRLGRPQRFPTGAVLFREGARSDHVVLVREGRAKVVGAGAPGREVVLAVRGPGELVGDLAAIDGEGARRSASLVAMTDLECQVLRGDEFRAYLESHPRVPLALLRTIIARLHDADRRRLEFGSLDASQRLAQVLVELVEGHGPKLALSQEELAGLVGTSRESVVRALRDLRESGVLTTGRRSVTVLDEPRLRDLAG
jgi:CRP/FNR family cyclic AMP-dependent transcriptional regulator